MSRITEKNKLIPDADITSEKQNNKISIPKEGRRAFIRIMNIGYYKEFHKQGLITDEQLHSPAAQRQYFEEYINEHEDRELIEIYYDEGITGTSTRKREGFNRMISDCEMDKINTALRKRFQGLLEILWTLLAALAV